MSKRVLVLDDDQDILDIVSLILAEEGYEVETLPTGHQAVEVIGRFQPHLILMDVMLADLDGRVICRQLKETLDTSHIPVILISGTHDLANSLQQPGAPDDFIPKPFDIDLLLAKVKLQLEQTTF